MGADLLESIDHHLRPEPITREAKLVTDFKPLLDHFFRGKVDYEKFEEPQETRNHVLARRLFVQNELDILCGFSKDYLAKMMSGHQEEILVGRWKTYRDTGLYVRFDSHPIGGICLSSQMSNEGRFDKWTFEWREDCKEDKGFLHAENSSYPSMKRALRLSGKFLESLKGYSLVAAARNPKTKAE